MSACACVCVQDLVYSRLFKLLPYFLLYSTRWSQSRVLAFLQSFNPLDLRIEYVFNYILFSMVVKTVEGQNKKFTIGFSWSLFPFEEIKRSFIVFRHTVRSLKYHFVSVVGELRSWPVPTVIVTRISVTRLPGSPSVFFPCLRPFLLYLDSNKHLLWH